MFRILLAVFLVSSLCVALSSCYTFNDISVYLYGSEIDEKAIKATYVGGSLYYDIAVLRDNETVVVDITITAACLSPY